MQATDYVIRKELTNMTLNIGSIYLFNIMVLLDIQQGWKTAKGTVSRTYF